MSPGLTFPTRKAVLISLVGVLIPALLACSGTGGTFGGVAPAPAPSFGPPRTAQEVVQGLELASMFPGGELRLSKSEQQSLTPGKAYTVYTISDEALEGYQPGQRVSDLVEETDQMIYTLQAAGRPRMVVELARRGDGGWELAGVGTNGPVIAQGIGHEEVRIKHSGADLRLVQLVHPNTGPRYFTLVNQQGTEEMTCIWACLGLGERTVLSPQAIIQSHRDL